MTVFALDSLDLAALLCSRVCHDVISPVGAIVNGLEVLEDEKDAGNARLRARSHQEERARRPRRGCNSAGSPLARRVRPAPRSTRATPKKSRAACSPTRRRKLEWNAPRVADAEEQGQADLESLPHRGGGDPARRRHHGRTDKRGRGSRSASRVSAKGANAEAREPCAAAPRRAPDRIRSTRMASRRFTPGLVAKAANMSLNIATAGDLVSIEAAPAPTIVEAVA